MNSEFPPAHAQNAGAGAISGVVVENATNRPMARVQATLSGSGGQQSTLTDLTGRFSFESLAPGQYTLNVQRPAYLQAFYGSLRPGRGPGAPIVVTAAQRAIDLGTIRMTKAGVITGVVTDSAGRPAANVRVGVLSYQTVSGERLLLSTPALQAADATDDRGVYRLYGLRPGEYLVRAAPIFEGTFTSPARVEWARRQIAAPIATGGGSAAPEPAPAPPAVAYAGVYHPGVFDPAAAALVTVGPGEERAGVDISLQLVPAARVEGIVTDSTGSPVMPSQLLLIQPGLENLGAGLVTMPRGADGRFSISNVAPGQYVIVARSSGTAAARGSWGRTPIALAGADLRGVTVSMQPYLTMRGTANIAGGRISLVPMPSMAAIMTMTLSGELASDRSVVVDGIVPATYRLLAQPPASASGSIIATSAMLNGQDVLDRPFDITGNEPLDRLVVTYSDQPAEISGRLVDAAGAPVPGLTVVLFTADKSFWGLQSRRTTSVRPQANGDYRFAGLLPGDYYLCAVTDVDATDTGDPTFYDALVGASIKVTVGAGEKKVQELRLAGR